MYNLVLIIISAPLAPIEPYLYAFIILYALFDSLTVKRKAGNGEKERV